MNLKFDGTYVTATNDIIRYYTKTFLRKMTDFNTAVSINLQPIRHFFQIVPVAISIGNRFIHTNVLPDTGSDATLLKREIATKLGLKGSNQCFVKNYKHLIKNYRVRFQIS